MSGSNSTTDGSKEDLDLPPIPKALPAILGHLHNSDFADASAVMRALRCNPDLESKTLRSINVQLPREKENLREAVKMIGPTTAAGMVVRHSVHSLHELRNGPAGPCLLQLVQHSEAAAVVARFLSKYKEGNQDASVRRPNGPPRANADKEESGDEESFESSVFARAFAHDLGKLVLIYNFPERASRFYGKDGGGGGGDELFLERCVFGYDHIQAGVRAAEKADLPAPVARAAESHHADGVSEESGLQVVRAANLITKAMGEDFSGIHPGPHAVSWEECAESALWTEFAPSLSGRLAGASPEEVAQILFSEEGFVLFSKFFLDRDGIQLPAPDQESVRQAQIEKNLT